MLRDRLIILLCLALLLAGCSGQQPEQQQDPTLPKHLEFAVVDPTATIDDATIEESCAIFKQRLELAELEKFAVDCAHNQTQPIKVSLPETADEAAITALLTSPGTLEFIDPQGEFLPEGTAVCTRANPMPLDEPDFTCSTIYQNIAEDHQFLRDEFKITKSSSGQPALAFKLNDRGGAYLETFTTANIGRPLSIVVDQRVISSPVINGMLPGKGIITFGNTSKAEQEEKAKQLFAKMKAPALPVGWRISQ
jgi:preprotein translocase subunit SecD